MNKSQIPFTLVYTRLLLGILIIGCSLWQIGHYKFYAVSILTIGLLTDIFDGIIARKLNVSSEKLRRLDSSVDQVFFIGVALATYIQCPDFFINNSLKLTSLISLEILAYVICYFKFKKEIATHSIGAKIWTLFIFATLIEVMLECESKMIFNLCFWIGIITRIEIIAIILSLKEWANDIPTIYHSLQLRQGKEIKRNKMFNG